MTEIRVTFVHGLRKYRSPPWKWSVLNGLVATAARDQSQLVLFPEEACPPHNLERYCALAKTHGIALCVTVRSGGKVYSDLISDDGRPFGSYTKIAITDREIAEEDLTRGCDLPIFDMPFGRVGILICFDMYLPELARSLADRGADLILYPLMGDGWGESIWTSRIRTRAFDNGVNILAASTGMCSMLVDRYGTVLASCRDRGPLAITAAVDLADIPTSTFNGRYARATQWREPLTAMLASVRKESDEIVGRVRDR